MSASPLESIGADLPIAIIVQILVSFLLARWGAWVAARQGRGRYWRTVAWFPWVSLASCFIGVSLGVTLLISSFGAVTDAVPAEKATRLAEGIATAMAWSAPFVILTYSLLLMALVTFVVGSLKEPRDRIEATDLGGDGE